MHLEFLVEDKSGKQMLDIIIPQIIGSNHTFNVHSYKGIGRIPKRLGAAGNASKRILLTQLPKLLQGYGKAFSNYPSGYSAAVIVVCDLDDKCLKSFRQDLFNILSSCNPRPETRFCFAIEEGEAWLLGDIQAIKCAYPKARDAILSNYEPDSICGTWEHLANAIYKGGAAALSKNGWQSIGAEKTLWARKIAPNMDTSSNRSPSFAYFREKLLELTK